MVGIRHRAQPVPGGSLVEHHSFTVAEIARASASRCAGGPSGQQCPCSWRRVSTSTNASKAPERRPSAADVLSPPLVATLAKGTVVVPVAQAPNPGGS